MLLPALYLTIVQKQLVPLHCSLLQQVVSAATLCWLPNDSPCWPLPTCPLPPCCLRYQDSAGQEHQLMLSILCGALHALPWACLTPAGRALLLQDPPAPSSSWKLLGHFCSKAEHAGGLVKELWLGTKGKRHFRGYEKRGASRHTGWCAGHASAAHQPVLGPDTFLCSLA